MKTISRYLPAPLDRASESPLPGPVERPAWSRRRVVRGGGALALFAALAAAPRPVGAQADIYNIQAQIERRRFVVIRRYQLADPEVITELVQRTEDGFVPLIRDLDGFVAYFCLDLGDGEGATISIFSDRASAEASTAIATEWAAANVADLVQGPPEVTDGAVLLEVAAGDADAAA